MLTLLVTGRSLEGRLAHLNSLSDQKPDFVIDGVEKTITIEKIRELKHHFAHLTAKPQRIHILEAQSLTLPSQHALLKTLEEPPQNTQFILTASKESDLLATIVSRCRIIRLQATASTQDQEALNQAKDLLRQINTSSFGELVSLASQLTKSDPESTLKNLQVTLKNSLLTSPTHKRAAALKLIQTCLNDLTANVNKELAVEHLLFELKSLT